jgi:addiction module HigA family antidote
MSQDRAEAEPITPGDVLRVEIRGELNLTQAQLAEALGVSRHSVNEIENDKRSITAEMATRLGYVLGTSPEFWLNLQRDVDLHRARREFRNLRRHLRVLKPTKEVG